MTGAPDRIASLDIVRGVAVMGILAMNIIAFGLPGESYINPNVLGMDDKGDFASWLLSFVFVDGKMRGLFSFLFGASMLLVIERAEAKGEPAARIHFRRMAWLLLFGLLHFYFIWWGDILTLYAVTGMFAWLLRGQSPRLMVGIGAALVLVQFLQMAMLAAMFSAIAGAASDPSASPAVVEAWEQMQAGFALAPDALDAELALHRGDYWSLFQHRLATEWYNPLIGVAMWGAETLGYMLFGMAALKTGFLTGGWEPARYRRAMLIGFGIGVPFYALLAWIVVRADYSAPALAATVLAGATAGRPFMIVATAALILLLARRGGALVDRIAAAGRAAFTNYLGTSILMTALFYGWGFGLYGTLDRAELWLPVIGMWALMLLWSKPWLDRFRYGPFEWLWRSLARGRLEPMRR
ncbi:MAG TPA: DUF418 domain-containing protein [Allosphingosinicella sp.]|nr:DUF418 domain-containing protein [Allosphingosinicella sp.]